jgi:hypothetical protein
MKAKFVFPCTVFVISTVFAFGCAEAEMTASRTVTPDEGPFSKAKVHATWDQSQGNWDQSVPVIIDLTTFNEEMVRAEARPEEVTVVAEGKPRKISATRSSTDVVFNDKETGERVGSIVFLANGETKTTLEDDQLTGAVLLHLQGFRALGDPQIAAALDEITADLEGSLQSSQSSLTEGLGTSRNALRCSRRKLAACAALGACTFIGVRSGNPYGYGAAGACAGISRAVSCRGACD